MKSIGKSNVRHPVEVSFKVVSLFTRVQVREALQVIEDLLEANNTLKTRTTMLPAQFMSLTRLCLTTTYFQFGSVFYEQVEGTSMGSLLSPVLATFTCMSLNVGH